MRHDYNLSEDNFFIKLSKNHFRASLLASLVGGGAGSLVVVVVGGVRGASRGLGALRSTEQKLLHA